MDPVQNVIDAASGLVIEPRGPRWAHLSLGVLDAVFSIGARYRTTTRTCHDYARASDLVALEHADGRQVIGTADEQPLGQLVRDVERVGPEQFAAEVLRNRQRTSPRGGVLKAEAALAYARILVQSGVDRHADVDSLFVDESGLANVEAALRGVPGNGTGDVRLGYLWMLLGHDHTVKPDRMVLRWLGRSLGSAPSIAAARRMLESAAAARGCTPWELDHAIWNSERNRRSVVRADPPARRRHRCQQGRWRDEVLGVPSGTALGTSTLVDSMLPDEHDGVRAAEAGWNLMSDAAVAYARERIPVVKKAGGVVQEARLWRNLLSSQPLAFSVAGELRAHPEAALAVLSTLTGRRIERFGDIHATDDRWALHGLQAEWAPRPDDHLNDRSAADLAAAVVTDGGSTLLVTIEVKYTDDFSRDALRPDHYDEHLDAVDLTAADAASLHSVGGTQFLRSVLLTDSVRRNGGCAEALAVVLSRADDEHARDVVAAVGAAVPSVPTAWWSIEQFLNASSARIELAEWADAMAGRCFPTDEGRANDAGRGNPSGPGLVQDYATLLADAATGR